MAAGAPILIVDDEFSIVDSLVEILSSEGYPVITAMNGQAALQLMERTPPALVLLDYMMPVMDGLHFLRALRADPKLAETPVILMTAAPAKAVQGEPLWNALLRKPFELDTLLDLVRRFAGPPPDPPEGPP